MLPDVQNERLESTRIDQVGIEGFTLPYKVYMKSGDIQNTVATISLHSSLSEEVRGVNMSRFSQTIMKASQHNVSTSFMVEILDVLKERLESRDSFVRIAFPYFLLRKAPVTENHSYSKYDCEFDGSLQNGDLNVLITVNAYYTSLCPCSRALSEEKGGAHNQRSIGTLTVHLSEPRGDTIVWIEDMIDIIEYSASCPIFNTLKREDEKWVTDYAYSNPKFVEDVARSVELRIKNLKGIDGWRFQAKHQESIHQYDAIAIIRGGYYIP